MSKIINTEYWWQNRTNLPPNPGCCGEGRLDHPAEGDNPRQNSHPSSTSYKQKLDETHSNPGDTDDRVFSLGPSQLINTSTAELYLSHSHISKCISANHIIELHIDREFTGTSQNVATFSGQCRSPDLNNSHLSHSPPPLSSSPPPVSPSPPPLSASLSTQYYCTSLKTSDVPGSYLFPVTCSFYPHPIKEYDSVRPHSSINNTMFIERVNDYVDHSLENSLLNDGKHTAVSQLTQDNILSPHDITSSMTGSRYKSKDSINRSQRQDSKQLPESITLHTRISNAPATTTLTTIYSSKQQVAVNENMNTAHKLTAKQKEISRNRELGNRQATQTIRTPLPHAKCPPITYDNYWEHIINYRNTEKAFADDCPNQQQQMTQERGRMNAQTLTTQSAPTTASTAPNPTTTHCSSRLPLKERIKLKRKQVVDDGVQSSKQRNEAKRVPRAIWVPVLLALLGAAPSLAKDPQGHSSGTNSLAGYGFGGNKVVGEGLFLQPNNTEITAQAGSTASLPCRLSLPLGDRMVSWVRRRHYQVLTVGRQVYSSDARVGVKVAEDGREWVLTIKYADKKDAGGYQCQVSSHPPRALTLHLHIVEAQAEIVGGPERYIHHGSSLLLVCLLKGATEPPVYVFWYRGDRMINYDQEAGVAVDNSKRSSKLYIASVSSGDGGNYTCVPSNVAPTSVLVTVIQKENPVGLLQNTNKEGGAPSTPTASKTAPSKVKSGSSGRTVAPPFNLLVCLSLSLLLSLLSPLLHHSSPLFPSPPLPSSSLLR